MRLYNLNQIIYDISYIRIFIYIFKYIYIYIYNTILHTYTDDSFYISYTIIMAFLEYLFRGPPGAPGTRGLDASAGHGAGSQSFGGPEASRFL